MLKDTILELCKKHNTTISALEKELGFANSSIARWDRNMPRADNLKKVADYFNVSVDSLLEEEFNTVEKKVLEEAKRIKSRREEDNDKNLILQELSTIIKNFGGQSLYPETRKIPIVGTIKCGANGIAYEDIGAYLLIDETLHGDLFALRTKGDSMQDKGIDEGDIAIIRKQEELENGEIGAFLIDGEEATLKRYVVMDVGIVLEPCNSHYQARYFINSDINRVKILGKLVEIRKRF